MNSPPERQRRALSSPKGQKVVAGDGVMGALMLDALRSAEDASSDLLTHSVHPWPARMHPLLVRQLLSGLASPGMRVLDPFMGGGTTLVEAQRLGLQVGGVDLNPLSRRVVEVKCRVTTREDRDAFLATLRAVGERSHQRVKSRAATRAPLQAREAALYEGHVLRELAGLWAEISALPSGMDKRSLEVLLAAIVVKFSRQRSDTSEREVQKHIGRHIPTSFFVRRGEELSLRWEQYAAEIVGEGSTIHLYEGDARRLSDLLGDQRFDLVITSPPYGGTYDYVDHHSLRYPWLGLKAARFSRHEMGARRRLSQSTDGVLRWNQEVRDFLRSTRGVMRPKGRAVLVMGDGDVAGTRVEADAQLRALANAEGLQVVAVVSEEKPDWGGRRKRREHLVLLLAQP